MKNLFILFALIGVFTIKTQAQFTTVRVRLNGACMSANANSRYVIKVEIVNISVNPPVPVITPDINIYLTEGFPSSGVIVNIDETACTPDGNSNIYKVYISAAKVWLPDGTILCDGKADEQPEYTCWGLINSLPYINNGSGILVELE